MPTPMPMRGPWLELMEGVQLRCRQMKLSWQHGERGSQQNLWRTCLPI